eukprot:GILK01011221.1.p1 GENE.GILK01011221.1~~GILK01011221.1.p1  ORF type:complete len:827 (-),score=108.90 GILK01011221.1:76-2556(-)
MRVPLRASRSGHVLEPNTARLITMPDINEKLLVPRPKTANGRLGMYSPARPSTARSVSSSISSRQKHQRPLSPDAKTSYSIVGGSEDSEHSCATCVDEKVFPNGNIYHGELRNGVMHGRGVYVWADGSKFMGQFREGLIHGYGEKSWPSGRVYCGEWRDDSMEGQGELTWPTGETYVGTFRQGIYCGNGTRTFPNGDVYTGGYKAGREEGRGHMVSSEDGWQYTGQWRDARMNGEGKMTWDTGLVYAGQWRDGRRDGKGKMTFPDGSFYEGRFRNGRMDGQGKKVLADGSFYVGEFSDGQLHGRGLFHWPDGTEFEGDWENNAIKGYGTRKFPDGTSITGHFSDEGVNGEGKKTWRNGCSYVGSFRQNRINGYGKFTWPDQNRSYTGQFIDEVMEGDGMMIWVNEKGETCKYKGQFDANRFNGEGRLEFSNGTVYSGTFVDGKYQGKAVLTVAFNDGKKTLSARERAKAAIAAAGERDKDKEFDQDIKPYQTPAMANHTQEPLQRLQEVPSVPCYKYTGDFHDGFIWGHGLWLTPQGHQYEGEFRYGEFEGRGCARYRNGDKYVGDFRSSMYNGLGTYAWRDGTQLIGIFEAHCCNKHGKKILPGGQTYVGEFKNDLEHGKGIYTDGDNRIVGTWRHGEVAEQLLERVIFSEEGEKKVFEGFKRISDEVADQQRAFGSNGQAFNGKGIVLYRNGDKYIGSLVDGLKQGEGMYVYADLTTYKGYWELDCLNGVRHPIVESELPIEVRKLHDINQRNDELIDSMNNIRKETAPKRTRDPLTTPQNSSARNLSVSRPGSSIQRKASTDSIGTMSTISRRQSRSSLGIQY